jgi:hypothetical protein
MKNGIKDPWRVVSPVQPEPKKPTPADKKRNVGEADFDADLRPVPWYDIRGSRGSVRIQATNGYDALNVLVKFLDSLDEFDAAIGYKSDAQGVDFNRQNFVSGAVWKAQQGNRQVLVCFNHCDNDAALLLLVDLLIETQRKYSNTYKRFGIEPIQK